MWFGVNYDAWDLSTGCSTILTRCGFAIYDSIGMATLASVYNVNAYPEAGIMLGQHEVI